FLVVLRVAQVEAGDHDLDVRLRGGRFGGVVVDLRAELLEFRLDRYAHLLEHGRHAAPGWVGFQWRGNRDGNGAGQDGGQQALVCFHQNSLRMEKGSMRPITPSRSTNRCLSAAATCRPTSRASS